VSRALFGGVVGVALLVASGACSSFGSTDATTNDSDGGSDAGSEGSAGEGGPSGACGGHDFCATFDEMPFDAAFGGVYVRNGEGQKVTLAPVRDPGGSQFVRLTVPMIDGIYAQNFLKTDVAAPASQLDFAFRVRVTKPNTLDGIINLAVLKWEAGGQVTKIEVGIDRMLLSAGLAQQTLGGETDYTVPPGAKNIADGAWHSFSVKMKINSLTNVVVDWSGDGTRFASTTFAVAAMPVTPVEVQLGITDTGSSSQVDHFTETIVDLDDVTYDAD
jgi:hypothetical protein